MQAHRVRRAFGLGILLALAGAAALIPGAPISAIIRADPAGIGLDRSTDSSAAPIGSASSRSPDRPAAPLTRALLDGFEEPDWPNPDLWTVSTTTAPTWWPSSCRARSGRRSLWAYGGQVGGGEQPCGAGAPPGAASTIVLRLDLRGTQLASRLELQFDLWMQLPPGPDTGLFIFLRVPQGGGAPKRVPVFGATGSGGDWVFPPRQLDLMNLADITDPREVYDLRGGIWELELLALAPGGTAPGAGVFIDDLILAWEPDPAVTPPTPRPTAGALTPTPTPTRTPTASATATRTPPPPPPSATPSATAQTPVTPTPTATRRATPGIEDTPTPRPATAVAYLPWTVREEVLWTPTPTSEVPQTPGTPVATDSATPTEPPKPPPLYLPWTAWEVALPETSPSLAVTTGESATARTSEPAPSAGVIGDHRRAAYN